MTTNANIATGSVETTRSFFPPLSRKWIIVIITAFLLLVAASRIGRLDGRELDVDEMWSVWQTFGTPSQVYAWTPYDWPPLYYMALDAWKTFVGIHPVALRFIEALSGLVTAVLVYRVTRRLYGDAAALVAMIALSAMAYSLYLNLQIRAYTFVVMFTVLALWLALRYAKQSTIRRAIPLALCITVLFYLHVASVFGSIMVCVFASIVLSKGLLRWIPPAVIAGVLAAPEIIAKASLAETRVSLLTWAQFSPWTQMVSGFYSDLVGNTATLWIVLFVIATVLIVRQRGAQAKTIALLIWILCPLILVYSVVLGSVRHLAWVTIGIALWMGWGLSMLRRPWVALASLSMAASMFLPLHAYAPPAFPTMDQNMIWLKDHIQWGDVLLIDPNCDTATAEKWFYYIHVYFPNGLRFVTNPEGYRRIWYVVHASWEDQATMQAVTHGRVEGPFVGPPDFLFRLYEAPPDTKGISFENGMNFQGADFMDNGNLWSGPLVRHAGEPIQLRLWWSVDQPVKLDYSVGIYVLDSNGALVAQTDGAPQVSNGPRETSRWVYNHFYIENRILPLPYPLKAGTYRIYLAVYQYADNTRVPAPVTDKDRLLPLQTLTVVSWT